MNPNSQFWRDLFSDEQCDANKCATCHCQVNSGQQISDIYAGKNKIIPYHIGFVMRIDKFLNRGQLIGISGVKRVVV